MKGIVVEFLQDDPGGLYRRGDRADDLGPESPGAPELRLLRLRRTAGPTGRVLPAETIALTDPYGRGIVRAREGGLVRYTPGGQGYDRVEYELCETSRAYEAAHHAVRAGADRTVCGRSPILYRWSSPDTTLRDVTCDACRGALQARTL